MDLEEFFKTINTLPKQNADTSVCDLEGIDLGKHYNWSQQHIQVRTLNCMPLPTDYTHITSYFKIPKQATDPTTFLKEAADAYYEQQDGELNLPKDSNGNEYKLSNLRSDQADIAAVVLNSIRKWLECDQWQTM